MLLRQTDILIAVADETESGKAGGTMESIRSALYFNLPVVLIDVVSGDITLLDPGENPASSMARTSVAAEDWQDQLCNWITRIVSRS